MKNINPIGIFDSGVGGLSVARHIRKELPGENLLYVADSFHAPYGSKPQEFIERRSIKLVEFLLEKKAKAIVVACNTATVSAIQQLRSIYSVPIIGIEPGVKPATLTSKTKVVGVLATTQTVNSKAFNYLAKRFTSEIKIEVQACPGLVEQVEICNLHGDETKALIRQYVHPLLQKGADTIVLGCTHYAFLIPAIKEIVGSEINVINTAQAVAKEVERRLSTEGLLSLCDDFGSEFFWTSGEESVAKKTISTLWGKTVNVSQI